MASKRIDELTTRTVADTDLLPVTPSGGPSGSATVAAIVAEGLTQPNSASAGAGASITIKAADGVTSGAGGSITITPGAQAVTGGPGKVVIDTLTVGRGRSGLTQNTAVGVNALAAVTSGDQNVAVGDSAGKSITTGNLNVGVGSAVLQSMTTGASNTAVGFAALANITTGGVNACFGRGAGYALNSGGNTLIGAFSGNNISSGGDNTAIGYNSAVSNTTGSNLIAIGHSAAQYHANGSTSLTTAANSIYIGYQVRGFNNSDSNSIVIGYQSIGEGANTTVVGNSSTTQSHLYGATQLFGSGAAVTVKPFQRTTSGAGNDVTIQATDGVTSGAGGGIIIEPGLQATTGGNGGVTIKPKTGAGETANIFRVMHQNATPCFAINTDGYEIQIGNGAFIFRGVGSFFTMPASGEIRAPSYGAWFLTNPTIRFPSNTPNVAILYGNVGIVRISNGSTGGGSLAYTSSTSAAITTSQNDYVLTGSAFQRLNCTTASDITGIAPPTGGAHVDGRMIRLVNVGTATVTLKHNSTSSTAANRMFVSSAADKALATNAWADLVYDSTDNGSGAAGWRVM